MYICKKITVIHLFTKNGDIQNDRQIGK